MQEKLPINSAVLKNLACIDLIMRGHSVTTNGLKSLATKHLSHVLSDEEQASALKEALSFQVDKLLPHYDESNISAVNWWGSGQQKLQISSIVLGGDGMHINFPRTSSGIVIQYYG